MDEPVLVSATPGRPDRRRLTVLVVGGLVLVLVALVLPKVLGGSSSPEPFVDAAPQATTTTVVAPRAVGAEPVAAHSGKDPFKPLVTPRAPERAAPPVVTTPTKTTVKLEDVYLDPAGKATAKVKVDASQLVVKVGQQFDGSYRVLTLDPGTKCGSFLFDDQPFDLCIGEANAF